MQPPTHSPCRPTIEQLLTVFQESVESGNLCQPSDRSGTRFYQRIFGPLIVLWAMVYQRLNEDHTCDAVVSYVGSGQADRLDDGHDRPLSQRMKSESNSAYCQARRRLPLRVFSEALRGTAEVSRRWLGAAADWLGHPVALLDGSTIAMRGWPELATHYGQATNQHGTSYWVIMRVVVAFDAFTGALEAVAEAPERTSEAALTPSVLATGVPGTLYVGDANFGIYSVVQAALHSGMHVLVRLTPSRAGKVVGRMLHPGSDCSVAWSPSKKDQVHPDMMAGPLPGRLLHVVLERPGFRPVELYLFTTLTDTNCCSAEDLVELYGIRWHVELNLRYVKSTLAMDFLHGKSVDIVRKELHAGLLAYNLIRGFMVQAARAANLSPLTLSFTSCWRRVWHMLSVWLATGAFPPDPQALTHLLTRLAKCRIPERERWRVEPRAVRRRPAVYPNLKGSREAARQEAIQALRLTTANS